MLLDKVITFIFPLSLLEGTPWKNAWLEKEQRGFFSLAKIFFPVAALVWLGHYFFFDLPMNLQPTEHWLVFRLSMAAIAIAAACYYFCDFATKNNYRLPAVLAMLTFCFFQARVTVWYPEAPWLYCFLFVCITSIVLQASVVKTVTFAVTAIALQWPSLVQAAIPLPTTISAALVTLILILASRSSYSSDVKYFLLNQQNLDTQKKNIELNIEFTDRIKSFIPGEVAVRLENQLKDGRTTVLQAIDEVLRPRKRNIACIFSDIRGFTESSKDIDSFLGDQVLPNVKACTNAVDRRGGIPRKIGDLIFAYYDSKDVKKNIEAAMLTSLEIAEINESLANTETNEAIQRYILVAVGEALVGNIGGFDSSVEITALGSPVNYLARLDEATKQSALKRLLDTGDILLSREAFETLDLRNSSVEYREIDLVELGIAIRDFTEQRLIYKISPTKENVRHFSNHLEKNSANDKALWNSAPNQAA